MVATKRLRWLSCVAMAVLVAAGCGSGDDEASGAAGAAGEQLSVYASFYPLQWMAERVGGDGVAVSQLTPPGVEPHDLELSPQDVAALTESDLVVYLSGFQPAVDDAVDQNAADRAFDAADSARLDLTWTPIEDGEPSDEAATDPHFWLDPLRLANVAGALAERLGNLDDSNAEAYAGNADELRDDLEALHGEFVDGLASCTNRSLVTSHNAFGYLAAAYGFDQVGISGLSAEDEPSPSDLAAVSEFVRDIGVTTIYYETLISPAIAETVATETGARTEVLDPIEGLTDQSQGDDYLEVMRANLANLRSGQSCP